MGTCGLGKYVIKVQLEIKRLKLGVCNDSNIFIKTVYSKKISPKKQTKLTQTSVLIDFPSLFVKSSPADNVSTQLGPLGFFSFGGLGSFFFFSFFSFFFFVFSVSLLSSFSSAPSSVNSICSFSGVSPAFSV